MKTFILFLALTIAFFLANAQTNVSGGIYTNTTWTKINSPYIVTDTIVVFPSLTLTIEPGVVVMFDDKMLLEIRQAILIANGTITDSIVFTSHSANPYPGIWSRILLKYDTLSQFSYCNFCMPAQELPKTIA